MRKQIITSVFMLGVSAAVGCSDSPVGLEPEGKTQAISTGETLSHLAITSPSTAKYTLEVGKSVQMGGTLFYNKGGTLPSAPYAQWSSSDNCVASVTTASPSWGLVKGIAPGTVRIVATAWGKADTVVVTVTGTGSVDPKCLASEWSWDYSDVSFTGKPASRYGVAAGEKLRRLVLFAPKDTLAVGGKVTVRGELWYSKGGKVDAKRYATFSSSDEAVATINAKGVVTGRRAGRAKLIARLGEYADTVPVYVK